MHGDCTAVARAAATMLTSPGRLRTNLCSVRQRDSVERHATSTRCDPCHILMIRCHRVSVGCD